jgi:Flagellar motor component
LFATALLERDTHLGVGQHTGVRADCRRFLWRNNCLFRPERHHAHPEVSQGSVVAPPLGLAERARQLVELAQKARREGLLALEEDARNIDDPFLQKGLQLVVDGTEPEVVRAVLESEIGVWEEREKVGEQIFTAIGGFCPTMGIMGAVLGLMHALGQSDDPKKMAKAIAVAFVATLYGVGFANLVFLPIAGKLKVRVAEKRLLYELTLEGILAIQAGENPRLVAEKLSAYLPPSERAKFAEQPVGAAA